MHTLVQDFCALEVSESHAEGVQAWFAKLMSLEELERLHTSRTLAWSLGGEVYEKFLLAYTMLNKVDPVLGDGFKTMLVGTVSTLAAVRAKYTVEELLQDTKTIDLVTCVQCDKELIKLKNKIIWVSAGIKTPCCAECAKKLSSSVSNTN